LLKNLLLEKSLYDIIADIWYIPNISRYVKALFGPLFIYKSPQESIKNFDDLHPAFK